MYINIIIIIFFDDFFFSQDIFLANQTEIIQEKRNKEKPTEI